MTAIPSSDALRTLNLAYRKMQEDFRVFAPDLFRTNTSLTTDATNGQLSLPDDAYEVEEIFTSNNFPLDKIQKKEMHNSTGYFHDGMDTSTGKRLISIRENGNAKLSTAYTVHYLKEYADLASTGATPYPFTGKSHLDMLTTLQAYYFLAEQGDSRRKEKDERWTEYQRYLSDAQLHYLDDNPTYGISTSGDAGDRRNYPALNVSDS